MIWKQQKLEASVKQLFISALNKEAKTVSIICQNGTGGKLLRFLLQEADFTHQMASGKACWLVN